MDKIMSAKKIIIGTVGVAGLAALAYYAYQRNQVPPVMLTDGGGVPSVAPGQPIQNPVAVSPGYSQFPNKSTVLRVAQTSWPNYFNTLNATYNDQTGTATQGDWKIKVVSNSPLVLQFNKGASESFKLREGSASAYDQLKGLGNISVII